MSELKKALVRNLKPGVLWRVECPDGEARFRPFSDGPAARRAAALWSRRGHPDTIWQETTCPGGEHEAWPVQSVAPGERS